MTPDEVGQFAWMIVVLWGLLLFVAMGTFMHFDSRFWRLRLELSEREQRMRDEFRRREELLQDEVRRLRRS